MTTNLKFHPLADIFPLLEGEEFDALVADVKANGLREKIDLYEGKIVDGRNRYLALQRLEIDPSADPTKYFRKALYAHTTGGEIAPHEQDNDARVRAYIISKNIHRRHLSPEQKRELIAKLIKAQPEKSDRQIAGTIKASPTTVGTVRAKMEATGDVSKLDTRTDKRGRKQPAKKSEQPKPSPEKKPIKADPRIIAPEVADRVGRFAHDLITADRILARELATIIMLPGVRERLSADLTNGLAITENDAETSAKARKAEFAALDDGTDAGPFPDRLRRG
jgi:hypothetical protein